MISGGYNSDDLSAQTQINQYIIAQDIISSDSSVLPSNMSAAGHSSVQIGHKLYGIRRRFEEELFVFNVLSLSFEQIIARDGLDHYQCVALHDTENVLYITGGHFGYYGHDNHSAVAFNVSSSEWFAFSDMSFARQGHQCIVDPVNSRLWAISGYVEDSVERISTSDIESQTWETTPSLHDGLHRAAAVLYHDGLILIMGGGVDTDYVCKCIQTFL